jgi:hypothetical protein
LTTPKLFATDSNAFSDPELKHIITVIKPRLPLLSVMLAMTACCGLSAFSATLTFNETFSTKGEPKSLQFTANYVQNGKNHQLSVWRDSDRRLKRSTDDVLDTFAFKPSKQAEFEMVVLDKKRMIRTDINRTNLMRIGNFTDWFDLGHGLKHPMGPHEIKTLPAYASTVPPVKPCRWHELTQGASTTRICWSSTFKLPMLMENATGQIIWKVDTVSMAPIEPNVFQINDAGFVKNDANNDIDRD